MVISKNLSITSFMYGSVEMLIVCLRWRATRTSIHRTPFGSIVHLVFSYHLKEVDSEEGGVEEAYFMRVYNKEGVDVMVANVP